MRPARPSIELEVGAYDFVIMIEIEHVRSPAEVLKKAYQLLRPVRRLGIVTASTGSSHARLGHSAHSGGYHFPRHFYLFNRKTLSGLVAKAVSKLSAWE